KNLDLNNPVTFNEKLQWLKVYWNDEILTRCADKYTVRDFVKSRGYGHFLNDLYAVYDNAKDISFEKLPNQFVLKATHGCGYNIICDDKTTLDEKQVKKVLRSWQKEKFGYFTAERHYWRAKPLIICEKYLENKEGNLNDYKFFCFNGVPRFIQVDFNRFNRHTRNIYDSDWNLIDLRLGYPNCDRTVSKPQNFEEMLKIASVLSKGFCHVRVDLYNINGKIIFGEMTFTHAAGYKKFEPEEYNELFGNLIKLPPIQKVNYK